MPSGSDDDPRTPILAEEDDWFHTPFEEPSDTGEIAWQDDDEQPPPPRTGAAGLGQRQAVVVLAVVAIVVVVAAAILIVRAIGGSDAPTTTPQSTTQTPTTPVATTPADTTPTTTTTTTPSTTTPSAASVPTDAKLEAGSSGDSVTKLQQALTQLGYEPGTADGVFGAATTQAVIAFQEAKGLTQDGVAGAATLAAINTAIAKG